MGEGESVDAPPQSGSRCDSGTVSDFFLSLCGDAESNRFDSGTWVAYEDVETADA